MKFTVFFKDAPECREALELWTLAGCDIFKSTLHHYDSMQVTNRGLTEPLLLARFVAKNWARFYYFWLKVHQFAEIRQGWGNSL